MTNAELDQKYMRIALREAKKGIGRTSPNPCVGAVIVRNDQIVGKGYHHQAGSPHAEVHALRSAGENAVGSTLYVTLEPCNHTGKTPPCSHAVAAAGIARVVVGMRDPNPLVDGSGITYLQERGIAVTVGILEEESKAINLPFIKRITTGLPWVIMKAGLSLDGKLNYSPGKSGWITGEKSGEAVHRLRNSCDAILVGSNTANIDNPSLTTRLKHGKGRDPIRIILNSNLSLPLDVKPFTVSSIAPTWVFCSEEAAKERRKSFEAYGAKLFVVPSANNRLDLREVFRTIGVLGVNSVLVEGGAAIHGAILREKLYDYVNLFVAPIFAGDGGISLTCGYVTDCKQNAISLKDIQYRRLGDDMMISGRVLYPGKETVVESTDNRSFS